MDASFFRRLFPSILLTAVIAALAPTSAGADVDSAVAALKTCVDGNIAAEKSKDSPSVEALLSTCNTEYQVFKSSLPAGARDQADHQLRDDIQSLLGSS